MNKPERQTNCRSETDVGGIGGGRLLAGEGVHFDSPNHPLGAEAQFNGNIAHMEWVIADSDKRRYGFSYDGFDRLMTANYMDHGNSLADYSVDIAYEDLAGNISTIERYGLLNPNSQLPPSYGMIDRLVMGYSGNRLETVTELAPQPGPDLGYIGHGTTMTYDDHGNLISCTQRNIGDIAYNHRHQPIEFIAQDEDMALTYDDEGNKIEQRYLENGVPTDIIKYEGGAIFTNGDLSAYNFGEGRIIPGDGPTGEWQLEFIIRDHLGNSRVWISDLDGNGHINCEEEILQVRDYYPFGMPHDLPEEVDLPALPYRDVDPFTYNNKEYEDRVTRMHDYHARWYDAALGRWSVVDPLASEMPEWSPYNYVFNNPMIFVDPDGRSPLGVRNDRTQRTTTQIRQTFSYDKMPSGENKRTGTDKLTKTIVSSSGQVTTTVVTSLTVDSDGEISSSAQQFAFTSSGSGDDHVFAMTEVKDVAIDRVDSDLLNAAEGVSTYKLDHGGDSPLQTRADLINEGITYGAGAAAAVLTKGQSINFQVGAATGAGVLANRAIIVSPENLSRNLKFKNETN